jgi:membrane fusion protein (multidrug efflux system)
VFSPLPPQNATGNWIKIVQRVPVRIALSGVMLTKYPLRLGLSMDISVDVKDTSGLKVPGVIRDAIPLWKTTIFSDQEKGVDTLIEKIFSQNQSFVGMISEEVKLLGNHRR